MSLAQRCDEMKGLDRDVELAFLTALARMHKA